MKQAFTDKVRKRERRIGKLALKKLMVVLAIFVMIATIAMIPKPVMGQQRGPVIDRIRFRVFTSLDQQVVAMMVRELDVLTGMPWPGRKSDIEMLVAAGKTPSSRVSNTPGVDSYYDFQQPELRGAVNTRSNGIGICNNRFTAMNIHWNVDPATIGRVDPDGGVFYMNSVENYPATLNVLASTADYEAIFFQMYEGLLTTNPWTGYDMPWIATSWSYATITGDPEGAKQWIQFDLRSDVNWQDGRPFNASEAKFAWDFLKTWQIPKYWYFAQYIKNVTVLSTYSVKIYMTRSSGEDPYNLAATAALLPSRVWEKNPLTGLDWTGVAQITGFAPNTPAPAGWGTPTYLYGTGPFIFQYYDPINGLGDEDANRNYWLTTSEIQSRLAYYLWRAGDTNSGAPPGPPPTGQYGGMIYAEDLGAIGLNFGAIGVPLGPPGPDITGYFGSDPDGKVDLDDLYMVAWHFGETISVPYP